MKSYTVPPGTQLFRTLMRPSFRGIFYLISRVKITGVENVPLSTSYLIAINHVSLFEAPLVLAFWPEAPEAAGAADIWQRRGQGTLARWYGGIPVHRGEYDRQLLETMISVLKAGRSLLLAPEGGRSHTPGMQRAMPGVAYLVEKTGAPVVPAGIVGSTDDFLERALRGERPVIEMHIGKPFHLPANDERGEARHAAWQRNADLIMAHIAALLPVEYQGVYASRSSQTTQTP